MNVSTLNKTSWFWSAIGVVLLLLAWEIAARIMGPMLMAGPWEALRSIGLLLNDYDFWLHVKDSLTRIFVGVSIGCLIGFVLGILAGQNASLRGLLEPLRWLLMAIPPVVVVVLAMLWFGLGSSMVIFITILMMAPGMYVNTVKGMRMIDINLLEMAQVYRYNHWQKFRHIYLPALAAPLTAALLIAACGGVRLVVMAEVLGAESGVGYALANARSTFDSGRLYAWVLLILALVALLEFLLLQPIQRRLTRWQEPSNA